MVKPLKLTLNTHLNATRRRRESGTTAKTSTPTPGCTLPSQPHKQIKHWHGKWTGSTTMLSRRGAISENIAMVDDNRSWCRFFSWSSPNPMPRLPIRRRQGCTTIYQQLTPLVVSAGRTFKASPKEANNSWAPFSFISRISLARF
jgi:hypothetical protein